MNKPYKALRRATVEDVEFLAPRLRCEDIMELQAVKAPDPLTTLLLGLETSIPHASVLCDQHTGEPYLMGGIRPLGFMGIGIVWLLGTPEINNHVLSFQRETKRALNRAFFLEGYKVITNVVHGENKKTINWLGRMGFQFMDESDTSATDEGVRVFVMSEAMWREAICVLQS